MLQLATINLNLIAATPSIIPREQALTTPLHFPLFSNSLFPSRNTPLYPIIMSLCFSKHRCSGA